MRVRLYRPISQRRARSLLGIALLIPGAGFLQATGANPVTLVAAAALLLIATGVVYTALRPVAIVLRSGIIITGVFGSSASMISWSEIVRIESIDGSVSLTTAGRTLYQIQIDSRAARFLSRMAERVLSTGAG